MQSTFGKSNPKLNDQSQPMFPKLHEQYGSNQPNSNYADRLNPEHQVQFRQLQYNQEFELIRLIQKHYDDQMNMIVSMVQPPPQMSDTNSKISTKKTSTSIEHFKPYTLEQYRKLKDIPILHNAPVPSQIGTNKWDRMKEKRCKMEEYGLKVKKVNDKKLRELKQDKLVILKPDTIQMAGPRQKAKQYAKLIPLPKKKSLSFDSSFSQSEFQMQAQDPFAQLEERNQKFKQIVSDMKIQK